MRHTPLAANVIKLDAYHLQSATDGGGDVKMSVILVEDEEMAAPTPLPSSKQDKCCEYTLDGSVDIKGRPAVKGKSGGWLAGGLILGI